MLCVNSMIIATIFESYMKSLINLRNIRTHSVVQISVLHHLDSACPVLQENKTTVGKM